MSSTIVTIYKEERDTIAKLLTEYKVEHTFFTVENNEERLQVEIKCIDPLQMWHYGKIAGCSIGLDHAKKILQ